MTGLQRKLAAARRRTGLALATAVALFVVGLLGAQSAAAQGAVFSIRPVDGRPYFIFNSAPGKVAVGAVRVVNVSTTAGQAVLYPVDATTGQTSGAVYLSPGAPRREVGRWLSLSTRHLTLGPHQSKIVVFTLRVPRRRLTGQYLGGLVAAPVQATSTQVKRRAKSSFRVNIREIAIVAVQVNLPGPLQQRMAITGLRPSGRPGYQTLLIGLANGGNTLVKGHGTLSVTHAGRRRVLHRAFALDTFVPHTSIEFPVYVHGKRLPSGRYRAVVAITYGDGHHLRRVFAFTISSREVRKTYGTTAPGDPGSGSGSSIPVWVLALAAVALVAASLGGSTLYFRRRATSS